MSIMMFVRSIGGPGPSPGFGAGASGQFGMPLAVAVDVAGSVYVLDRGFQVGLPFISFVYKFDRSGKFVIEVGGGSSKAVVQSPESVAVDNAGNVYIATGSGSSPPGPEGPERVIKFDGAGNLLLTWGSSGFGQGQFLHFAGIAVDTAGYVYVADFEGSRVQKFDGNGKFILAWGGRRK